MIKYLLKKPFSKSLVLSRNLMKDLLVDLPKKTKYRKSELIDIKTEKDFKNLILANWEHGTYQLNDHELSILSTNKAIQEIKRILIKYHDVNLKDLFLKSSCLFIPQNCKYVFNLNNQNFLYHKYHLDSGYRIKALIMLEDSIDEKEQFSYIDKFPENKIYYYLKIHFYARIIVFFHKIIYLFSFKKIKLSGQPPNLPLKYQNPELYKKYNSLKFGELLTFHNLYPHSSHNGASMHKTLMLQLVFNF